MIEESQNVTEKEVEEDSKKIVEKLEQIENIENLEKNKKDIEQISKDITEKLEQIEKEENPKQDKINISKEKAEEFQKQLIEKNIENKKNRTYLAISTLIILLIFLIFSTIFALININNQNFVKGVKVKNIDISGLSIEEAKTKINEALNVELLQEMNLKYNNEYEIIFDTNQIEYIYDIDKAINQAYQIGRSENIFKNNYELLYTAFLGKNIDVEYTYNEEYLNNFINDIESKIPGLVVQATYYIEGNELIVNKGKDGITVNKPELKEKIISGIKNRSAEKIIENNAIQEIEIPIINTSADPINMEKIYSEIHTEPKDAYYELEPFKIYPEENGIDLEMSLEDAINQVKMIDKEEYRFNLKITPAEKTIKDLGTEAFPHLISSFSTKYDASNKNRSQNLAIAAQKINGVVLLPGETFSFNKVVGKRTVEEGYKDAKIYADGGVVDGLAGGICQISSTLYNAVLLANLEIVERRNHSFTTSYVPAGRDATVVYGTTDFQFKNSRTYPIKIEASVTNGIAMFKIHGISEETEYEIKIIPKIMQSIPYTTEYIQDATLAPGQQVVVQAGHSGYKVTTYKEVRKDGIVISRDLLSNDTYKPMRAIVRIGP